MKLDGSGLFHPESQQPLGAPVVGLIRWEQKVLEEVCNPSGLVHTHLNICRILWYLFHMGKLSLRSAGSQWLARPPPLGQH